jgi:LytS/YehU family sensor histidine kinase
MALLMAGLNFPLDYYTVPNVHFPQFALVYYMFNWTRNILIWALLYHVFHYFERLKNNEIEKFKLSSSVRDFESKLLRSQLNPHFVFNALNGIRGLVIENPEKAQQSITQLSRILRNSLVADRHKTVSLQEELKTVQDYLELEKIRYEERLQIKIEVAQEAFPVQVPPMMVQTLVENAIKHGVSKPIHGGFIAIQAERNNGHLHLYIRNTGKLSAENSDNGTGFGLISTQQRLSLIYGENKASFQISQESENVVCAELEIPVTNE